MADIFFAVVLLAIAYQLGKLAGLKDAERIFGKRNER